MFLSSRPPTVLSLTPSDTLSETTTEPPSQTRVKIAPRSQTRAIGKSRGPSSLASSSRGEREREREREVAKIISGLCVRDPVSLSFFHKYTSFLGERGHVIFALDTGRWVRPNGPTLVAKARS